MMEMIIAWIVASILALGAHTGTPLPPPPALTATVAESTVVQSATSTATSGLKATKPKSAKATTQTASPLQKQIKTPTQQIPTQSVRPNPHPAVIQTPQVSVHTIPAPAPTATPNTDTPLSNNNYYTNSSGNTVHAPAHSEDGSVPAGASARCRDGTYSFSQHNRGTCSHHGGVAEWL